LDDHPARATPYTPSEVMPSTISNPILTSVISSGVWIPKTVIQLPMGMTEIEVSAKINAIIGAAMYSGLNTCGGVRSSLKINLAPSASGCSRPKGPTRVGPQRFWICADTLRSSQTLYATAVSRTPTTATDLMIEMMMNVVMLNVSVWRGHSCPRAFGLRFLVRRNFRHCRFVFEYRIQSL